MPKRDIDPRSVLSYDPGSGLFRWLVSCGPAKAGSICCTRHHEGYFVTRIGGKNYSLHRLAFLFMGCELTSCVDHINGDRTDNRWVNLRQVTPAENAKNRRLHANNSSGISGVTWTKQGRWQAYGHIDGRPTYLGGFSSLFEAAAARKSFEFRNEYHANHGTKRLAHNSEAA